MRLHLTIAYFGQRYHGWQRQPGRPTVQQAVEMAAARVFDEPVIVIGASRTDAGVHAEGQSAHMIVTKDRPINRIAMAMNARLPTDIDIRRVRPVSDEFDARKSACWKHYRYRIHNTASRPIADWGRIYHYWRTIDDDRLRSAAVRMVGAHDFAAFAHASSQPRLTTVRTIYRLDVTRLADELVFDICGDGFLYKMIRNTVGALLDVGRGHHPPEWIDEMLAGGQAMRAQHGPPAAPAQGLTLLTVSYLPFPQVDV
ncbi:MAG: tRNA pseudouridine(38-40) synthase TruA [Phycisphaerae bacterium]|nr:tRNA pseudouridine(38-40) synthase TruA [Phycisphaerae bacterium]